VQMTAPMPSSESDLRIDVVVKLGGGLLAHAAHFEAVLATLVDVAASTRLLIVPGGGPFADTVRRIDRDLSLSDDAAHWMAVLAMDQYAHLVVSRLHGAALVNGRQEIAMALAGAHVPVLAPSRWLHEVDPLPHSWDVTSDSIAAWVAGMVRAPRLVLVKPPQAGKDAVDPYFHRIRPPELRSAEIVPLDQVDRLRECLTV
jgi:5-(aminomethyl)-3-furanmethanol phosphate kinase